MIAAAANISESDRPDLRFGPGSLEHRPAMKSLQLGMHWFAERQGGLDRVYYELSRALPQAGVAVSGLVCGSPNIAAQTNNAIRAFAPQNASLPKRLIGMRQAFAASVRAHNPDVVVSHFALYTLPILGRLGDRPLVVHFHGPWAEEGVIEGHAGIRTRAKKYIEHLVYRRATRAIVLSQAFANVLADRYAFPVDRIHVIAGGIATQHFAVTASREAARARLGWPQDRPIVVAVRRLVPRMGLENLLSAVAIIRREIPDLQLMIAGRGALQTQLARQIENLGLANTVFLIGFVSDDDLPYVYRAAHLSVVPSLALEGFGLVAAESLAAGTPCLVSPVGGLPEVVSPLSPQLVLRAPAVHDLAEAISGALQGRLILPDDVQCRAYAERNFDWRIIASKTAEIYRLATQ